MCVLVTLCDVDKAEKQERVSEMFGESSPKSSKNRKEKQRNRSRTVASEPQTDAVKVK